MSAWRVLGTSSCRLRRERPLRKTDALRTMTIWIWTRWACTARRTVATAHTRRASSLPTECACSRRLWWCTATAPSPARCATAACPWRSADSAASSATGCWRRSCPATSRAAPSPWNASCATAIRWTPRWCASSAMFSTALRVSSAATPPADRWPSTGCCRRLQRRRGPRTRPAPPRANRRPAWITKRRTTACTAPAARLQCATSVWRRANTASTTWSPWPPCGNNTR